MPGLDTAGYRQAFALGERTLAKERIIEPTDNFLDLLEKKLAVQAAFLKAHHIPCTIRDQKAVADAAYQQAADNCLRHRTLLMALKQKYRLGMVSNFYGNLHTVLEDFGILDLFETVTESAVAGVKKPDPQIWQLGCDSLALPTAHCAAIGDSLSKDMVPATEIGCLGFWLQGKGWEDDPASADKDIERSPVALSGLPATVQPVTTLAQLQQWL